MIGVAQSEGVNRRGVGDGSRECGAGVGRLARWSLLFITSGALWGD